MGRALKKAKQKWSQFRIESALRAGETQSLIVNLALIGRIESGEAGRLVVFVENFRDALLIRLLSFVSVVPRGDVIVVREMGEMLGIVREQTGRHGLSVIASRLFLKHYQHLIEARNSGNLVII
jgi:hypothetical protein